MTHSVDGFELKFTGRRSWKAIWSLPGRPLGIVPVTFTIGRRQDALSNDVFLQVWYRSPEEFKERTVNPTPFVVALATAKDYSTFPYAFDQFVGLFRVIPTGIVVSENSIETRVLERVRAKELEDA